MSHGGCLFTLEYADHLTIAETIERARASAIPGREQCAVLEVWSAVRQSLGDRRPVIWRPLRRVRHQGRYRPGLASK